MAKLFNGMINFASAIKPTGAQPLDDRTVVQSFADLLADETFGLAKYNGMLVAVIEDEQVYMLKDAANSTSEDAWIAVGSGNGSLAVDTYAEAVALATDDNIGQVIYVKTKSSYDPDGEGEGAVAEYDAAPYIVIGKGQLQKLAASTASGNLDADVAELKTKVSGIESEIGKAAAGEDAATGLYKEIADAEAAAKTYTDEEIAELDLANTYEAKGAAADALADAKTYADGLDTAMNTRVEALEAIDHDAYIAADTALEGKINTELGKKVDKVEGSRLMTDTEGAKLAGIAEGAQVNVIEKVIFNGTEVVADAQTKTITLTTPQDVVRGLADGEKVLSLDAESGKLGTTLGLTYYTGTTEAPVYEIQLTGKENEVLARIDAKAFVKDGMLNSVELEQNPAGKEEGTYLIFTWNEESGVSEPMYVPVTDLIDVYVAGNGIAIDDKVITAKVKANDTYIEVTTEGIASKGIDSAITTAKNDVIGKTEDASSALTVYGAKKYADEKSASALADAKTYADGLNTAMNTRVEALEAIDHDHANKGVLDGITAEKVAAWDAAEQNAKDYADDTFVTKDGFNEFEAAYEEKLNAIEAGAEVNVIEAIKVNGIDADVSEGKVAEVKVDADDIELGTAIKNGEEEKYAANTKLNVVLQGIQDSIRGAIADGVNSVAAGDMVISVNSADANNPVISLKVEEATEATVEAGHIAMIKGDNGLYGMMYYDGDDSEIIA